MGMFSKPSLPVPVKDALTWQAQLYGMPLEDYLRGGSTSSVGTTPGFQAQDHYDKGNPFFTATNQPSVARSQGSATTGIARPFLWQGNNKSLRKVNQDAYNSYWNENAAKTTAIDQQATWGGPQIRPEYASEPFSLSTMGDPQYWQDNNQNHQFEANVDDTLDTSQSVTAQGPVDSAQAQAAPAEQAAPAQSSGGLFASFGSQDNVPKGMDTGQQFLWNLFNRNNTDSSYGGGA